MFFQKINIFFSEIKGMNTSRRKIPPRFVILPLVLPGLEWHVVQYNKFSKSSPNLKKKKKNAETKSYGEKTTQ